MIKNSIIKNFSIYRASAGSGKTYILTYNYIRLALIDPDYFKSILAVTFTNKATEEMKSRILETLKQLAKGEHGMAGELMKDLDINQEILQHRADNLLRNILHNYSFFAVTTIDTFFQKVVRSFAREVGIQTGFKIELDQTKVISEVIDKMLAEMGKDQLLISWLTDFAIFQINQGNSWDTRKEMKSLSSELFKEFMTLNKKTIFANMSKADFMPQFIRQLEEKTNHLKSELLTIGDKIGEILEKNNLSALDFTYGIGGVGGYMNKIRRGEFETPGVRVFNAINDGKWCKKGSEALVRVEQALDQGLGARLSEAVEVIDANRKEYETISQIRKYLYTFGLLSRISEEINNYRSENDLLLISDFPVFLNEILQDSETHYIYEKVGTRYKHYLIDEFQDTSGLQWNNFRPLVKDTLSYGNFSMVVGDIKQSIYRWRGGNWKILLEQIQQDIGQEYIQNETLKVNRRSKQNIVEFNNELFALAPEIIESSLLKKGGENIEGLLNITAAYDQSDQALSDESREGLIDLLLFDKKEMEKEDEELLVSERLIVNIQTLQDAKYALKDIAILVRNHKEGRKVSKVLMQQQLEFPDDGYRYEIISNESLFLKNNAAIHLLFQCLRLVMMPDEQLTKEQLKYAFQQYNDRLEEPYSVLLVDVFVLCTELNEMNLSDMVAQLIEDLRLFDQSKDHAYLLAFQDAILDYLQYSNDSLIDFMEWWDENDNRSIQVADDLDAIRLMTVHKSKGLQFKAVILPFCSWKMDHSPTNEQLLWCDTLPLNGFDGIPYVPIRYKTDVTNTHFVKDYFAEKSDIYLDNLNLLYVAVTRAEEALFITSPFTSSKEPGISTIADVLKEFASQKGYIDIKKEADHPVILGRLPHEVAVGTEALNQISLSGDIKAYQSERINFRNHSALLDDDRLEAINYGDIVHWIYAKVAVKDDFANALTRAQLKFGLKNDEMGQIRSHLRQIWELPRVADWFGEDWEVKNESSILLADGKMKRPDRVVVKGSTAVVIDYKTGEQSDKHQRQVGEYKNILKQMGYQQVLGYLLYMSPMALVEV